MIRKLHGLNKGAIAWMAGNPVAANLAMVVMIVGGLYFMTKIKQEVFPAFEIDVVNVTVPYPGASPEEVEQGIVLAIEEAVQDVDNVEKVTSSANEGSGNVSIEMVEGGDLQKLADDVQSAVDRITTFPEDAEDASVVMVSRRREVLSLVIFGKQEERVLHEVAEQIRDKLIQDENITQVDIEGVRPMEISIEVSQEALRQYGLTVSEIASRVKRSSIELPGGSMKTRGGEILVRMDDRRDYGVEFGRIPIITSTDGTPVFLEDIATIRDGYEDVDRYDTYNGMPSVGLSVYRIGDQTPLVVANAVMENVELIRPTLPKGIHIEKLRDRSLIYRQRLNLLMRNGAIGLVLVLVLLTLFLEIRLAFWVAMGVPISFFGAFLLLPTMDVSINMVSLFAFIIALGIVVDDAIVVGENIYTYRQKGMSFMDAAIKGSKEVAIPVTFSILTNVVAFMPLYFVPGFMGKIFKNIPMVVCTVFVLSLLECLFVLPAHLSHKKAPWYSLKGLLTFEPILVIWDMTLGRVQQAFSAWFKKTVRRVYGPILNFTLHYRYATVSAGFLIFMIVLGYIASGRMGFTLFPKIESDRSEVTVYLPYGSAVSKTEAVADRLVEAAKRVVERVEKESGRKLSEGIQAEVGRDGSHGLRVRVYLTVPEIRPMSTSDFTTAWRKEFGHMAGLQSIRFASDAGGPGHGAALSVELSHRNIDTLDQASARLAEELKQFGQVKDIDDGFEPGKEQLSFKILPEGRTLGLTSQEVARQVRNAYYGAEVVRQLRGRNEVKVVVRLPENQRNTEQSLERFLLRTTSGTEVPLGEVVNVERGRAFTTIRRRLGKRVVTVTSDVVPRKEAGTVIAELKKSVLPKLESTYPGLTHSFEGRQAEQRKSMGSLRYGLLIALALIYALLAIPFRSYVQPLIIMISIPFGIVGAVIGHAVMGYSLSVLSMFGIVALSGVVVNDALVLIDAANRRHQLGGMNCHDAMCEAGIGRFRPILLTTMTTFGGLAPMIFETERQARFLIPMAISLGFGIVFSTLITLVIVPSLYLIVEDLRALVGTPDIATDPELREAADVPILESEA